MAPWPDPPSRGNSVSLLTFAVLDLETTGLSARGADRICEIAIVRARLGRPPNPWTHLVHPGHPFLLRWPRRPTLTTGWWSAPRPSRTSLPLVQDLLAGTVLVAHNAPFNVGFLRMELQRVLSPGASLALPPVLDTCVLARQVARFPSYRLEDLSPRWGWPPAAPPTAPCRIA